MEINNIFGIFLERVKLEKAVKELRAEGFNNSGIRIISDESATSSDVESLTVLGITEDEARIYEACVREGGHLISIRANSSEECFKAKDLLESCGAQDISVVGEQGVKDVYLSRGTDYGEDSDRVTSRDV